MKFLSKYIKDRTLIVVAILFSILINYFAIIKNENIIFFYDQARDAIISQNIIKKRDIKIQGPSASGTNDSIHHGVLYYYLIAPLYIASGGDPRIVVFIISILTSTSLIPIYYLTKELSKSKLTAFTAIILTAISIDHVFASTWLSNPVISVVSIPWFFYLLWRFYNKSNLKLLPWIALLIGISNQSAIVTVYLFCSLLLILLIMKKRKKKFKLPIKTVSLSLVVYLTSVSTMILNQALLYKRGIFSLSSLTTSGKSTNIFGNLLKVFNLIINKISINLLFEQKIISLLLFALAIFFVYKKWSKKASLFLFASILSPFILILLPIDGSIHSLIGLELLFIIPFSFLLVSFVKNKHLLMIPVLCLLAYNSFFIRESIERKDNHLLTQPGMILKSEMQILYYTYDQARQNPFSISTLTNPYTYNTTWSYLYSWYGQKQYGYTPVFYGASQAGIEGDGLLKTTNNPLDKHFSIIEPSLNLDQFFLDKFEREQNDKTELVDLQLGDFKVSQRRAK